MENNKRKYSEAENKNEPVKKKLKVKHNKPYIKIILPNFYLTTTLIYYKMLW